MRIIHTIAACVLAASSVGAPSSASAEETFHGVTCQPDQYFMDHSNGLDGFYNNEPAAIHNAFCPTPTDQAIGNARWRMRLKDNSSTRGFSCHGAVLDANGAVVVTTAAVTTSNAFTGSTTLTASAASGGYSTTFYHVLVCNIPNDSAVMRITID